MGYFSVMDENFCQELISVARMRAKRHERRLTQMHEEHQRRERRTSAPLPKPAFNDPWYWQYDRDFDPNSVVRRSAIIAHGITNSIKNRSYSCHPPVEVPVRKKDGSQRMTSSFSIPDETVSSRLYKSLLRKNSSILSSNSFAYRPGLVTYDAIRHVRSRWGNEERLFVAEFDFKKYFDNIGHGYLLQLMDELDVYRTPDEDYLIRQFLFSEVAISSGNSKGGAPRRVVGVPQGTSISLFLANLALTPLDRALDRLGVGYVRYADDTLIWSDSYSSVAAAVRQIEAWSKKSGVDINYEKSNGVRILKSELTERSEMPSTLSVDFLGHSLYLNDVSLSRSMKETIKRRVDRFVWVNLLEAPDSKSQKLDRLNNRIDRDYVTLLSQLRKYLYGNLSEKDVRKLAASKRPPKVNLGGIVAAFPASVESDDWRELDEYIRTAVWLALRKRRLLLSMNSSSEPQVWSKDLASFDSGSFTATHSGRRVAYALPSAVVMARAVDNLIQAHGPTIVNREGNPYRDLH